MKTLDISTLSPEDKLNLLDELWSALERDPTQLGLSQSQQQELDRRLDAMEQEGATGLTWNEVVALARQRLQ